ncbi:Hypothetical predicted protein [Pelobates cultripes]|uniref:Uncharacterized protein n=1 Tax=Pelobates cultripes TaxID=61616 RepID=A0AAD1RA93_PELCU|nr:Hypothetical predicted protein [Pelobates cultripes]
MSATIPTASHPPHPGRKALAKVKHSSKLVMDSSKPVTDGANIDPPQLSSEEESALTLDSDLSNDLSDLDSDYRFEEDHKPSTDVHASGTSGSDLTKDGKILDPQSEPLFELCGMVTGRACGAIRRIPGPQASG